MNPRTRKVITLVLWVGLGLMATSRQFVDAAATNVTTLPAPSGGQAMSAKVDAKGVIHLVCDSSDGPQYFRSADNGKTFSAPTPLLDQASRKPGLDFITWDMAVSPEGGVHVVLGNNAWKLKLPKDEWGYFYTRRLPDETAFTPLKNINHKQVKGFRWQSATQELSRPSGWRINFTRTSRTTEERYFPRRLRSIRHLIPVIVVRRVRSMGLTDVWQFFIEKRPITIAICIWRFGTKGRTRSRKRVSVQLRGRSTPVP